MKRYVVVSDIQAPFHSPKAIKNLSAFIKKWKPDEVLCVGDELDMPMLGKFNIGKPQEFLDDLGRDRDICADILYDLQVTQLVRSNHQQRLYHSIAGRMPALLKLPELDYKNFLRLDELGITFHPHLYNITRDWVMVHGDEGQLKPQGGQTALQAALRRHKSVVCGHTHRQGITSVTTASEGRITSQLTGVEVGHLTDIRSTGMAYAKGTQNWQLGFAILYVDKEKVSPVLIPMEKDCSFIVEGKRYG